MIRLTLLLTAILIIFVPTKIQATANVLPKKVWGFTIEHAAFEFSKVSVITDGQNKFIRAKNYKVKHISDLSQIIDILSLDPSNKEIVIVDYFRLKPIAISLAYGLTEKVTLSIATQFMQQEIQYTQDYINFMSRLNQVLDDDIIVPNKNRKAAGFGDITLGLKYQLSQKFSTAFSYKGGFLRTGTSPRELTQKDGIRTLPTGDDANIYTVAAYYDIPLINKRSLDLTAAYEITTNDYEHALDNKYETNRGDTLSLVADTTFKPKKYLHLTPQVVYSLIGRDRKKVNGNWQTIPGSNTSALLAQLTMTYQPAPYFQTWLSYTKILSQEIAQGNFDFPGRLYIDDMIKFGATLYYK